VFGGGKLGSRVGDESVSMGVPFQPKEFKHMGVNNCPHGIYSECVQFFCVVSGFLHHLALVTYHIICLAPHLAFPSNLLCLCMQWCMFLCVKLVSSELVSVDILRCFDGCKCSTSHVQELALVGMAHLWYILVLTKGDSVALHPHRPKI